MDRWIECPECHTGYQANRIGVSFDKTQQVTIVCQVCKKPFDANIVVAVVKSRWNPFAEGEPVVTVGTKTRVA